MVVTTTLLSNVGVIVTDGDEDLLAGELRGISLGFPHIFNSKENKIFFFLIHFLLVLDCVGIACKSIVEILIHFIF